MSKSKSLIDELLAAAGGNVNAVDTKNPADVERYFTDIVMGADNLSDAQFGALSAPAQVWLNAVAAAMNSNQSLADAAFGNGMALSDLPHVAVPVASVSRQADASGAAAKESPPAPVLPPKSTANGGARAAYSKSNPWGRDTKSHAVINAVVTSDGGAAHDIAVLLKSIDGGMADASLKQSVIHALQAFDCMRERGWLDLDNPAVKSFIKSIEVES